jgi:hypothetical protein
MLRLEIPGLQGSFRISGHSTFSRYDSGPNRLELRLSPNGFVASRRRKRIFRVQRRRVALTAESGCYADSAAFSGLPSLGPPGGEAVGVASMHDRSRGLPARMKRSGILCRCSRLFGLLRSLPSNQSGSCRQLPLSQVLENGMHIEVELSCELLAYLTNFRNNRVFRHHTTLPSILPACRSPACCTLLGCTQLQCVG